MKKSYIFFLFAALIAISFVALLANVHGNKVASSKKMKVTTSFYPLYFFASTVGGEWVGVQNITPPGAEPHDYEPTPNDIIAIEQSDILIINGGKLEAWGNDIRKNMDPAKTTLVVAGEGLTTQTVVEEGKTITDPHVWLSPPLAKEMVGKILAAFVARDPEHTDYYTKNAGVLVDQLNMLDQEYRAGLHACQRKDFVTSHAAFGYLASTYELDQISITGISPDTEPSSKDLAAITQFVRAHHITVIFFESLVSPKLAQTIATETGSKTLVLDPIEGISLEALKSGSDYLTVMRANLQNLQIALSCS